MENNCKIQIQDSHIWLGIAEFLAILGMMLFWMFGGFRIANGEAGGIPMILCGILCAAVLAVAVHLNEVRKTTLEWDGSGLCWCLWRKQHRIPAEEIESVSCAPYTVHSRYRTHQRMRLTVRTQTDSYSFTDALPADQQNVKDSPLMQLFLAMPKQYRRGK